MDDVLVAATARLLAALGLTAPATLSACLDICEHGQGGVLGDSGALTAFYRRLKARAVVEPREFEDAFMKLVALVRWRGARRGAQWVCGMSTCGAVCVARRTTAPCRTC